MSFSNLKGFGAAVLLSGLVAMPMAATADEHMPGEGTTVRMARANWDTGWFQAYVYEQLLEQLGYNVPRIISLQNPAFYASVATGDVDLWANGWFPLHDTYSDDFKQGARKIGYVAKGGALQGYLVSKKHAEKYNITNLEDFKREEVKKAFDTDGDGKAEMVACPPGWGCEVTIEEHWDAYELNGHVDLVKADYSPAMADALARYKNGDPVFFYTWTPNWTVNVFKPGTDVLWIEVPFTVDEDPSRTTVEGMDSCVADPCNLGWVANDIRAVANKEFLRNNVAATVLLEEASIPLGDIAAQNARMQDGEDSREDLERHAREWIEKNRGMVDRWLQEARDAAS
jgi:glycine betaine/proline transport system substrate-binding protein